MTLPLAGRWPIPRRYGAGGIVESTKRLHQIDVEYVVPGTPELIRRYDLDYEVATATKKERLESVTECAGTGSNCLSPTTFSYYDGTVGLSSSETPSWTTIVPFSRTLVLDINGDGHSDLAYPKGSWWWYRLADGNGAYVTAQQSQVDSANSNEAIVIDYDSDGLDDLLVTNGSTWLVSYGSTSGLQDEVSTGTSNTSVAGDALALDFNGDGRDDLIYGEDLEAQGFKTIKVRYRDTNGFASPVTIYAAGTNQWALSGTFRSYVRQDHDNFFDVNGDGVADLGIATLLETTEGMETFETYYVDVILGAGQGAFVAFDHDSFPNAYPLDMNGDGYTDIAYSKAVGSLYTRLSNGTSFAPEVQEDSISGLNFNLAVVMDYNGDGLQDLVMPAVSGLLWYLLSDADTLEDADSSSVTLSSPKQTFRVDNDGDGLDDYGYTLNNPLSHTDPSGFFFSGLFGGFDGNIHVNFRLTRSKKHRTPNPPPPTGCFVTASRCYGGSAMTSTIDVTTDNMLGWLPIYQLTEEIERLSQDDEWRIDPETGEIYTQNPTTGEWEKLEVITGTPPLAGHGRLVKVLSEKLAGPV